MLSARNAIEAKQATPATENNAQAVAMAMETVTSCSNPATASDD
jgi:hypothetical protein